MNQLSRNELHTPTIAPELPKKNKRGNGFSAPKAIFMKAKLACIFALALAWIVLAACQARASLSADPLGQAGSLDLYAYCNGDPVNGIGAEKGTGIFVCFFSLC